MKRTLLAIALVLAVLLGGTFVYFKGKRYAVVITQAQIDAGLSERFPATKRHLLIFSITYSNPKVTLLEGSDRIQVGVDATLNIRINGEPKELGGGATVTSAIRYDGERHEFFLDDAVFDRLEIQGVPDKWLQQVTDFASKTAKESIETRPVYRLEAKDSKTAAAKLLLKGIEIHDQAIHVILGI
jgi:hypothetical protein